MSDQEKEQALQVWREWLQSAPLVIEGNAAVWDDGYEQQGLYINEQPLSEWLLATIPDPLKGEFDFPIGKARITLTIELLGEGDA